LRQVQRHDMRVGCPATRVLLVHQGDASSGAWKFANVVGVGSFSGRVALDKCPLALAIHKEVPLSLVSIGVEHHQVLVIYLGSLGNSQELNRCQLHGSMGSPGEERPGGDHTLIGLSKSSWRMAYQGGDDGGT
jgi:hypothetical protein